MNNLDFDEINRTIEKLHRKPVVIGMAISPKVKAMAEKQFTPTADSIHHPYSSIMGFPYIVDPRLNDIAEIYYDLEKWHERCIDQRKWDEQPS